MDTLLSTNYCSAAVNISRSVLSGSILTVEFVQRNASASIAVRDSYDNLISSPNTTAELLVEGPFNTFFDIQADNVSFPLFPQQQEMQEWTGETYSTSHVWLELAGTYTLRAQLAGKGFVQMGCVGCGTTFQITVASGKSILIR